MAQSLYPCGFQEHMVYTCGQVSASLWDCRSVDLGLRWTPMGFEVCGHGLQVDKPGTSQPWPPYPENESTFAVKFSLDRTQSEDCIALVIRIIKGAQSWELVKVTEHGSLSQPEDQRWKSMGSNLH